jgi:hypothetical protein
VLVVATRSPEAARVDVDVDLTALGLAGDLEAFDVRRGAHEAVVGGRLAVSLPPRSYTFVTLGAPARGPR